jgi:hypothetical protein
MNGAKFLAYRLLNSRITGKPHVIPEPPPKQACARIT